jgi:hypothetical protein
MDARSEASRSHLTRAAHSEGSSVYPAMAATRRSRPMGSATELESLVPLPVVPIIDGE